MKDKNDCPFCKKNRDKDRVLYESDEVFVFRDLFPVKKGHLLVIPQKHRTKFSGLTKKERLDIFRFVDLTKEVLSEVLGSDGFNVGFNLGEEAGQTVEHLHLHVIPRYEGDGSHSRGGVRKAVFAPPDRDLKEEWRSNRVSDKEKESLLEKMKELTG